VAFKRNPSLTKGEIDAYWRVKKKKDEEEHFGATSNLPDYIKVCTKFYIRDFLIHRKAIPMFRSLLSRIRILKKVLNKTQNQKRKEKNH
jgi:hypothetical protein